MKAMVIIDIPDNIKDKYIIENIINANDCKNMEEKLNEIT